MILGMSISLFTTVHVIISLAGIVSGVIVLFGMLTERRLDALTALFLAATVLTSVTGFFFHSASFGPPHVVGVISLAILATGIVALYVFRLHGAWRRIYVSGAVAALYFNVFVGIVQAFQKLSFLEPLAPTQSEPPFLAAQVLALLIFVVLGIAAAGKFRPAMDGFA
jgi:hypothetical protein